MPGSPDGNSANDRRFYGQWRKQLQDAADEYKASGEMERQRIADDEAFQRRKYEAFERRKLNMKQNAAEAKIRGDIHRRWAKEAIKEHNLSTHHRKDRTHERNEILKEEIIGAPYIPVEEPPVLGNEFRKTRLRFQLSQLLTKKNRSSSKSGSSKSHGSSSKSGSKSHGSSSKSGSKSHGSSSKSSGGKKKRKTRKIGR